MNHTLFISRHGRRRYKSLGQVLRHAYKDILHQYSNHKNIIVLISDKKMTGIESEIEPPKPDDDEITIDISAKKRNTTIMKELPFLEGT